MAKTIEFPSCKLFYLCARKQKMQLILVRDSSGRFYHALGNVTYDQGSAEDSLNYHHKALLHYKSTLGNNHHRTAAVFVKVAEHNIRIHQFDTAIALLDHALKVYSMSGNYVPEKARASFKQSHALRSLRRVDEADKQLRLCFRVYSDVVAEKALLTGKERPAKWRAEDLVDQDFDDLVAFWSKQATRQGACASMFVLCFFIHWLPANY